MSKFSSQGSHCLSLTQVIALVHYIELSKVEIATTLNFLVRYLCVEEWETDKNSGALYLRVQ